MEFVFHSVITLKNDSISLEDKYFSKLDIAPLKSSIKDLTCSLCESFHCGFCVSLTITSGIMKHARH
jgi:hypothetical protein